MRSVFNSAVVCIKKPPSKEGVGSETQSWSSAVVPAHGNGNEGWLHQASASVVIIRVEQQPEGKRQSHQQTTCRENFNHALSSLNATLIMFPEYGATLPSLLISTDCNAVLELLPQEVVVQSTTNQHQLILAGSGPVAVIDREPFARQVEHVPTLALLEPQNSFGSKNAFGEMVVEKVLKRSQIEGVTARERQ